jgi:hypothetical protein
VVHGDPDVVTVQPGELIVGGTSQGAGLVQYSPSTNDFYFRILNFATAHPLFGGFGYSQTAVSTDDLFTGSTGSFNVTAVPLPSSFWMALTRLAALGLMAFRAWTSLLRQP